MAGTHIFPVVERPDMSSDSIRHAVRRGITGGIAGTIAMTVYRAPVFRALPPSAEFWAVLVGGEPDEHVLPGIVLHLWYGVGAGALCGLLASVVHVFDAGDRSRGLPALALGTVYSLVLSAFGDRVLLRWLLDLELDADETLVFHVGHLVYGLTLGTWLGVGERTGRSDDRSDLDPEEPPG